MGIDNLTVCVLNQIGTIAMQNAWGTCCKRRCMPARFNALATRLATDQADFFMRNVIEENAHRIGAAAYTGQHSIRLLANHFRHLPETLFTHHGIKIAHHHRVRVRTRNSTNDVESVFNIGHPIAHRFIERIFKRF